MCPEGGIYTSRKAFSLSKISPSYVKTSKNVIFLVFFEYKKPHKEKNHEFSLFSGFITKIDLPFGSR